MTSESPEDKDIFALVNPKLLVTAVGDWTCKVAMIELYGHSSVYMGNHLMTRNSASCFSLRLEEESLRGTELKTNSLEVLVSTD